MIVIGYKDGKPFSLEVDEVEDRHLLAVDLVPRAKAMLVEARANGMSPTINSAWRANEKQRFLYDGFKAGHPGFNPADPPGYSNHQSGTALDIRCASHEQLEQFAALASGFGFTRPVEREPWHFVGGEDPVVS